MKLPFVLLFLLLPTPWNLLTAREIDASAFPSLQAAVNAAEPGDVVVFPAAIIRESVSLRAVHDITIDGNGATLDGADPLPAEGWEELEPDLHRIRLPRTQWDRHLLIHEGKVERMGRTQSGSSPPFPAPQDLKEGEFSFVQIDERDGWLHVRGSLEGLEWSVRTNGLATSGECSGITVKNLNTRHFLNDGFNIHGHAVGMKFENIRGEGNFDEGFSAHDTCECEIDGGLFRDNENAVADVNDCVTHYRNCTFTESTGADVLLRGREHSLTNCRIENVTDAVALTASPEEENSTFSVRLCEVMIQGRSADQPARVRINGGSVFLDRCDFRNVTLDTRGAVLEETENRSVGTARLSD